MMRRVSSRQRFVSWDSFDATQRRNDGDSSGEESSLDEGHILGRERGDGAAIMMMIDSDGHIERDLQRLDQSDPIPFNEGFQKLKRKRSFKAKYAPTTSIFPPRFPIVTFLSSAFSATKDMTTPEGRQIASLDAAAPLPFPPLPEAAAEPAATIICAFESLVRDDILVQVCGFLFLKDVRSVCQVNSRIRNVLLPPQGGRDDESSLRDDYVWKQQAQFLWNLPMEQQKWTTEMNSRFDDLGGETSPLLSRIQLLSLAHHPIPTEFDASIFTPCRWSRTLRSGTIVVRASLRKELEVIPTADGRGPAVRFLGRTGLGDRSVRTNAPLPRPDRLLWRAKRGAILRNPFARPHLGYSTSSLSANRASSTTPLLPAKWRPFVAPSLSIQSQGGEHLAWNVAPRLLSYFEVELLPPSAAADSASSGMCGRSAAEPMISGDGASSYMSTRTRRPHYEFSIRLDSDAALARHGEDEAQTFGSAFRHSKECVAVGLATEDFSMHTRMPGWDAHSWGYHGDDAGLFHGAGSMLRSYGTTYGCGDTVGCGVDWVREKVFFTLNGQCLGDAFDFAGPAADIVQNNKALYPMVGVDTKCLIRVNLTGPFQFDLHEKLQEQAPAVFAALQRMKK